MKIKILTIALLFVAVYSAGEDSEYITFDVGSGSYFFELTG